MPGEEPSWQDYEVVGWFLQQAWARGIAPTATYQTWVIRSRLFFGDELVAGPKVAAWYLPGGAHDTFLCIPADGYILTDGSVVLENERVRRLPPSRFNSRGLATLANLLHP